MFVVLRTLQGAITGTVAAATVLVASTIPREEAGYGLGLLQTAVFIGSSVGPMLGGIISDIADLRTTFFITSGLLAAGSFIIICFVHEDFDETGSWFLRSGLSGFLAAKGIQELSILLIRPGGDSSQDRSSACTPPVHPGDTPVATLVGSTRLS
jgi:MFS family permease